jgi:hypothetical protein
MRQIEPIMMHEMFMLQAARSPDLTQLHGVADGLRLSFPAVKVRFG